MPNPINNVNAADAYSDPVTIQDIFGGRGGTFIVLNNPVYYQLQYGRRGETFWTEEAYLNPGAGSIEAGGIGIRFRNGTPGAAAGISAKIAPPSQPILTLTAAGVPLGAPVTGRIAANGTIDGGTGFTCVRNSAGNYTITFTSPFASTPTVVTSCFQTGGSARLMELVSASATALTVQIFDAAFVVQDAAWHFLASPTA